MEDREKARCTPECHSSRSSRKILRAPVVQWLGYLPSKQKIRVRFPAGAILKLDQLSFTHTFTARRFVLAFQVHSPPNLTPTFLAAL